MCSIEFVAVSDVVQNASVLVSVCNLTEADVR